MAFVIDLIKQTIEDAAAISAPSFVGGLLCALGKCIFEDSGDVGAAIKCTEAGLDLDTRTFGVTSGNTQGANQLAQFLARALTDALGTNDTTGANSILEKLNSLSSTITQTDEDSDTAKICNYFYGLGLRLCEGIPSGKRFLRRDLRWAKYAFSRDLKKTEWKAWGEIKNIFKAIGDTDAALAAVQLQYLSRIKFGDVTGSEPEGAPGKICRFGHMCNGSCPNKLEMGRTEPEFYHCPYCHDTDWCPGCMELLKSRDIPSTLCSANHSFLTLRPLKRPTDGYVQVGEKEVDIDEWMTSWPLQREPNEFALL